MLPKIKKITFKISNIILNLKLRINDSPDFHRNCFGREAHNIWIGLSNILQELDFNNVILGKSHANLSLVNDIIGFYKLKF